MPNHDAFGAAITSAAATAPSDIGSQLKAAFAAMYAELLKFGRSLIDEPAERAAIEDEAVKVFNGLFASSLGPIATGFLDSMVRGAIDRELSWLAASPTPLPPVTPDPPAGGDLS